MKARNIIIPTARIGLGWVFLWAFLDKTFGLGWSTPSERAWTRGGSPTSGYLGSRSGWFEGLFGSMAGSAVVDWVFMIGLLGIGLALMLGMGMRIAAAAGTAMLGLMFLASIPFPRDGGATNPIWDSHLVQISLLLILLIIRSERYFSLAGWWSQTPWVQKYKWLQ